MVSSFSPGASSRVHSNSILNSSSSSFKSSNYLFGKTTTSLNGKTIEEQEEETRLKVLDSRRKFIRSTLKAAEQQKNYRIREGLVPEIDPETGKPIKSDSKAAITLTAFVVAAAAVTLRVGGRAALVSAVGLDFAGQNPELKENMDQFLNYANGLNPGLEALFFVLAWTLVKVLCFDAGGVVLALSAGILFGGVLQGAFASALSATIGSSVAYFLAKIDSPVRKKALDLLDEYPSLRGIEKVVAEDGLKAILTLRLAPVLPIPIGFYNYIYGVTNVGYSDFALGIFIGSFKPYLLDSYLGYFGKQVVDGTLSESGGLQDIILLVALGVSVLIGVFASELAGETWDSVKEEIEKEEAKKKLLDNPDNANDGVARQVFGIDLPEWVVGAQLAIKAANDRMDEMIKIEYNAAVWNCTEENPPPLDKDPAVYPTSPEIQGKDKGFDAVGAICESFVLSPLLFTSYFKYSDPLFEGEKEDTIDIDAARNAVQSLVQDLTKSVEAVSPSENDKDNRVLNEAVNGFTSRIDEEAEIFKALETLKKIIQEKLVVLEKELL
jgi:uncharacterized membrane protein YdjX (TVP38/TMEM64 family)